jgi:hypothetical protein
LILPARASSIDDSRAFFQAGFFVRSWIVTGLTRMPSAVAAKATFCPQTKPKRRRKSAGSVICPLIVTLDSLQPANLAE